MSETGVGSSQLSASQNREAMLVQLRQQIMGITGMIHALTAPEVTPGPEQLSTIRELGAAAYSLALAEQHMSNPALAVAVEASAVVIDQPAETTELPSPFARPDVYEVSQPEVAEEPAPVEQLLPTPAVEPIVVEAAAPVPEAPAVLSEPLAAVAEPATDEVTPVFVAPPEPEAEPAASSEPETFVVTKLPGVEMSGDEVVLVQKIVDHLSTLQDRIPLKDILKAVTGTSRTAKAKENRIMTLLDGYASYGVLRAYGRTYGYVTGAERLAIEEAETEPSYEFDPLIEEHDIPALEYFEKITEGGTIEANIGQFVRGFFNVTELDRGAFNAVIERLNMLAERGYLVHAQGSPWYGLGARKVQPYESLSAEPEAIVGEPAEVEAAPDTAMPEEAAADPEYDLSSLGLSKREQLMTMIVLATQTPGKWFRQRELNFSSLTFASDGAKNQAFGKLTPTLIEAGILEGEGQRGGRKYRVITAPLAEVTAPTEESSEPEPTPEEAAATEVTVTDLSQAEPAAIQIYEAGPEFEEELLRRLKTRVEYSLGQGVTKVSDITRILAGNYGTEPAIARTWINKLVESGEFHIEAARGMRTIVAGPAPEKKAKGARGSKEAVDVKAWTEQDITNAFSIFDQLLGFKHVQQGAEYKDLVRLCAGEQDEADFRRSLRRIVDKGFLDYNPNGNPNTRSDHSKKLYLPIVTIKSQRLKNRIKKNPAAVRAEMMALLEQ